MLSRAFRAWLSSLPPLNRVLIREDFIIPELIRQAIHRTKSLLVNRAGHATRVMGLSRAIEKSSLSERLEKMFRKLVTHTVESTADARSFFDRCAPAYTEQHGDAERLFKYRADLIKQYARPGATDVLLDLACGTGEHLLALAGDIRQGIGVDLSPGMIEVAQQKLAASFCPSKLIFRVDNGEELATLADDSVDVAICTGAFEHMLDKRAVLANVYRVLRPAGRFFCLTLNGGYIWYKRLAPLLGLETRHLSTDRFLTKTEFVQMLSKAGFSRIEAGYWTFIPKGDISPAMGTLLAGLDGMAKVLGTKSLRGGLLAYAEKEE